MPSARVCFSAAGLASLVAFGLAAPALADDSADPVAARVDGYEIRRSAVEAEKQALPQQFQQLPLEMVYPALVERLVAQRLMAESARATGLADDPAVAARMQQAADAVLRDVFVQRIVEEAVTEESLAARYEAFKKEFDGKEELHARHILVEEEDAAKEIIAELDKGADFAALAQEKSTGPSGPRGGDLGWFKDGDMVPAFYEAADALEPEEYTKEPVKTQFGWHVIKLEETRPAEAPAMDEVRQQLANEIAEAAIRSEIETLRGAADVEVVKPAGPAAEGGQGGAAPKQ